MRVRLSEWKRLFSYKGCNNLFITVSDSSDARIGFRNDRMSRIVILVGSVRRNGNTAMLAQKFAEGAALNNEVEIISVADHRINPCIGCNSCYTREDNKCFQDDGMDQIYDRLSKADVLVIASPVYFYGISAQLKCIIDRLHTPLRYTFNIRRLALLLVAANREEGLFDPIISQYRSTMGFFGLSDAGIVTVDGVKDPGDIAGRPELDAAYELGRSIS